MDAALGRDVRADPPVPRRRRQRATGVRAARERLAVQPPTIDRVESAYERQLEADGDEGQQSLDASAGRVQLEQVREDLAAKADQFEQREERLRERFAAAENR